MTDLTVLVKSRRRCTGFAGLLCCCLTVVAACQPAAPPDMPAAEDALLDAMAVLGLEQGALSLSAPEKQFSRQARLALVDALLQDPLHMVAVSRGFRDTVVRTGRGDYLAVLMELLDPNAGRTLREAHADDGQAYQSTDIPRPIHELLARIAAVHAAIGQTAWPAADELERVRRHLVEAVATRRDHINDRLVVPDVYTGSETGFAMEPVLAGLIALVRYLENAMVPLAETLGPRHAGDWETPLGRIRIARKSADHHTGPFLLLIDPGGNDTYENAGSMGDTGAVSVVIDLGGDDTVNWDAVPGPGAGILGLGLWIDVAGDDSYTGRNFGIGAGLFGAGMLWEQAGDDHYASGSLSQGAGQYGVGILLDEAGDDAYSAEVASQGFGGPGGYGLHIDAAGNDTYTCGGSIPDSHAQRVRRHDGKHYFSFCQGFGFGMRPVLSGGIGVLLDRAGNDRYAADLFAQGAATWFGFGLLTDAGGDDSYQAFEHCQGEGLHAGVGLLGDWGGNDRYTGHEHCQGAGVDLAAGWLVDRQGDDVYRASRESQGAGIKPLGRGLFTDIGGDDVYTGGSGVQGYAPVLKNFPPSRQPLGILVDIGGADRFSYPGPPPPSAAGRRQNRHGLAVDREPAD